MLSRTKENFVFLLAKFLAFVTYVLEVHFNLLRVLFLSIG